MGAVEGIDHEKPFSFLSNPFVGRSGALAADDGAAAGGTSSHVGDLGQFVGV